MISKTTDVNIYTQKLINCFRFLVKLPLTLVPFMVPLSGSAIGHFAFEFDILEFQRNKLQKKYPIRGRYIAYFNGGRVSNRYLLYLIREKRIVLPYMFGNLVHRLQNRFGVVNSSKFEPLKQKSSDKLLGPHVESAYLTIKSEDIAETRKFLSSKLDITKPLVLVAIRDSGYDEFCIQSGRADHGILERQAYRNANILEFSDCIKVLLQAGYSVLRIGRHSNSQLIEQLDDYYDYSVDQVNQADMLDVVFHSISKFCISTGTGIDELSNLFRKRIYTVNLVPPSSRVSSILNPMILLQDYYDSTTGLKLSLNHIIHSDVFFSTPKITKSEIDYRLEKKGARKLLEFTKLVVAYEEAISTRQVNSRNLELQYNTTFEVSEDGRFFY
jgi:putative glycosyltransferase (TIGR04372 family)